MQPDFVRKPTSRLSYLKHIGEELRQLECLELELLKPRLASEVIIVMLADHRGTTSRRANDVLIRLKDLKETFGQRTSLLAQASVRHRLPTTRLSFRELNLTAKSLKHRQSSHADLRKELVDVTRKKKSDLHERPSSAGLGGVKFSERLVALAHAKCERTACRPTFTQKHEDKISDGQINPSPYLLSGSLLEKFA